MAICVRRTRVGRVGRRERERGARGGECVGKVIVRSKGEVGGIRDGAGGKMGEGGDARMSLLRIVSRFGGASSCVAGFCS